jgi:two-component system phosphate regulon sensor histidine kinase PhoR
MTPSARKFILAIILFLGAGVLVGYYFEYPLLGLLLAALLCLAWQVRQLLRFDKASRSNDFGGFGYGDGLWEQIFSRFSFQRERSKRRKVKYRDLLREVRKSTDAMPDGAVILDSSNEIVTCNRAAIKLAGLKRSKDRGQRIDNILRDPQLVRLIERSQFDQSVEIASPVDDDTHLNCRVVPYGADQKLLLIRDVTERFRLNKMRRDFVANASHELRSPLTVISGYLDALSEDGELSDEWVRPIAQMQGQSVRMNRILVELMELSRLESAGSAPRNEAIDIPRMLNRVRESLAGGETSANVTIEDEADVQLLGSRAEIESVVSNLLSNAQRFTSANGEITLSWRLDKDGAKLIVSDNGDGIEAVHIPRLTERFYRIDRGRSREDGGVGLGLAIVKHVVALHDGHMEISSEPGMGSQFCCIFPPERLQ